MQILDWTILIGVLLAIVGYGIWKGCRCRNVDDYLLANRKTRWHTITLSVMATQASAITFLSLPGLAYNEGVAFLQLYFGLPIAMVLISMIAIPVYQKLKGYSIYEYLEVRFDLKTRILGTCLFLIQRGLVAGLGILAPSLIFSAILGWDLSATCIITGFLVILYTALGGARAVKHTHSIQMGLIFFSLLIVFGIILSLLPAELSFGEVIYTAEKMGRLTPLNFEFNWEERYNIWSGLIGGLFLALAYFGTDQSQTQRYLSGSSIRASRMSLLVNGLVKIPMQAFILLIGVLIFIFYQFNPTPLNFNPTAATLMKNSNYATQYDDLSRHQESIFNEKQLIIDALISSLRADDQRRINDYSSQLRCVVQRGEQVREDAAELLHLSNPSADSNDTNFIFLHFVTGHLPAGLVGLIVAAILSAAMAAAAAVLNALATTTVYDGYQRLIKKDGSDRHYLLALRLATIFWGSVAIGFSLFANQMGSLIEAVNVVGSLFYGPVLGIFILAFFNKSIKGSVVFSAAIAAELIVLLCYNFSTISYLWYNVVGCLAVLGIAGICHMLAGIADWEKIWGAPYWE